MICFGLASTTHAYVRAFPRSSITPERLFPEEGANDQHLATLAKADTARATKGTGC